MPDISDVTAADLDVDTLYALLRLRVEVFVVEQECAYPELDGHDLSRGTRHVWTSDDAGPTSYLRVLGDAGPPDASGRPAVRIGRVCTRRDARGSGLAADLMHHVLSTVESPVELHAQSYLVGWYSRFGFSAVGDEFLDDGIPHVPMRRPAP